MKIKSSLPAKLRHVLLAFGRFIVAALLSCTLISSALAQLPFPPGPIHPTQIHYIYRVPESILTRMPMGATSLFYGRFKLSPGGRTLALHAYAASPHWVNPWRKYPIRLDLFQSVATRNRRKAHYEMLSSNTLIQSFDFLPTIVDAQLLWLNPTRHQVPILKLKVMAIGMVGPAGSEVAAVFPHGLNSEPVTLELETGGWRGGGKNGEVNTFDTVDANGLLEIREQDQENDAVCGWTSQTFTWNGEKYVVSRPMQPFGAPYCD